MGAKDKKKNFEKEQLVTMDGNHYFPASFASKEYLEQQEKRRSSSVRRSIKGKDKKSKNKKNLELCSDEGATQQIGRSPNVQNIPT